MSPILEIQKRARELGRIRIGQVVADSNGKNRPEKLDRFRLTSASKPLLDRVAQLYGGEVRQWQPQGGGPEAWEVLTTSNRIPIMVPPQPVTQWLEHWTAGGCKRRCDGQTEVISDSACICAADSDRDEDRLCRPTTRLNVVLRDVEGIGVWRLETHGWNAATELPDVAAFLAHAGGYVEAWLALEERKSIREVDGKPQTRRFMVPTIEVDVTPAELMAGKGGVAPPQVEGPVPAPESKQPPQLEAGRPDYVTQAKAAASLDEVRGVWKAAKAAGHLTDDLDGALSGRAADIQAAAQQQPQSVAADPRPEPVGPDADAVWERIIAAAGDLDMTTSQIEAEFAEANAGLLPESASAGELQVYLDQLQQRAAA